MSFRSRVSIDGVLESTVRLLIQCEVYLAALDRSTVSDAERATILQTIERELTKNAERLDILSEFSRDVRLPGLRERVELLRVRLRAHAGHGWS